MMDLLVARRELGNQGKIEEKWNLKTWLVFLVDCNRNTNRGRNWYIMQSFLSIALSSLTKEELETVRSAFFCM